MSNPGVRPIEMRGPALVFGGAYSNVQALRAVLAFARAREIPARQVISTGDLVAYGADAAACVDLARASGIIAIRGNCEENLGAGAADCGCGFAPGSSCDALSAAWYGHALAQLDEARRAWLAALPPRVDLEIAGLRLAVLHGAPSGVSTFVFPSGPTRVKASELALLDGAMGAHVDGVIVGHSGLPFTQSVEGRLWHNSGALGMPANDGTPRVWCSVLVPGGRSGEVSIEHVALDYDHAGAAGAMRAARLPEAYARALETGLWADCDILPEADRKAGGKPLGAGIASFARGGAGRDWPARDFHPALAPAKFQDAQRTAAGAPRAHVALKSLDVLWLNTGTLCNIACAGCYIESSPKNDRLAFLSAREARNYLDEIADLGLKTRTIGFTGGEPFLNRDTPQMLEEALGRGFHALVLTNAMRPMRRYESRLLALRELFGDRLALRVSLDHYTKRLHEVERGPHTWSPAIDGLVWLARRGFNLAVAARLAFGESESQTRAGFARLFAELGVALDCGDPERLALFPEMEPGRDTPEISEDCWSILGRAPDSVMCASSRMVVKPKGAARPHVVACTLLPYDPRFALGASLKASTRSVSLVHPWCSSFCVLGAASCGG
jgi:MoaA/NifB/PqqE/SkfB family radical SAM enzyme/predicted phosphodiesterase